MFEYVKPEKVSRINYIYGLRLLMRRNPDIYEKFVYDCLNSGVLKISKNSDEEYLFSHQSIEIIKGLLFESRIVDIANSDNEVKRALYLKSTSNKRVAQKHLDKFEVIGTGLISTKEKYFSYYNDGDSRDAIFIRPNYKTKKMETEKILYTSEISPLQIKSSRDRWYLRSTVNQMIAGRYDGLVLTCLEGYDGVHTKECCIEYINSLKDERKIKYMGKTYGINKDVRNNLTSSIICPEDIYISQNIINEYEEFVHCWINGALEIKNDKLYSNVETALTCFDEIIKGKDISFAFEVEEGNNQKNCSFT